MAYRQRNRRTRQTPEKLHEGIEVENIYARYFLSIGLANERGLKPKSPEFKAAFAIKFGKPEHRRLAWLRVRDALRPLLPEWVFEAMDQHFTHGPATHFTHGFSLADRRRMLAAVTS